MPKAARRTQEQRSNESITTEVPTQAPQSINPFNSIDPFIQQYQQQVAQPQPIQQNQMNQMVPEEQYLWYMYDQFGNFIIDQYGPVVIDIRNGLRVNPVDGNGNFMPFPLPQQQAPIPVPHQQPTVPSGVTTTSRIIRGTDEHPDLFELDEDFFLMDSEKDKFMGVNDVIDQFNQQLQQPQPQYNPMQSQSIISTPVNLFSTVKSIHDLPIKIRYSEKDFQDYRMTSVILAEHLIGNAIENHPEIRCSLAPIPNNLYELKIWKNGWACGSFTCDLEGYGGKGLPIMYGTLGKAYNHNFIVVPLGSTKAVEECIVAVAYNSNYGVDAVTEAKFKYEMLPEHIYRFIDFGVTAFPDGLKNYKQFGQMIEHINKYYQLPTRYRLYGYKDNFHFTLVSDEFVKPFNGIKAPITHQVITVENNTLTIKEPNGNTKVVQMGA